MNVKEFLNNGRKLNLEINELIKARDKSFSLACGTAVKYDDERVQTSPGNVAENKFIHYTEITAEIDRKINELYSYRCKMYRLIDTVKNSVYRAVLIARYINCDTWKKIADNTGYDIRHIHRIHGQALREISYEKSLLK